MVQWLEAESRQLAFLADDNIEAFVGADRSAVPGDAWKLQHQALERGFLVGKPFFQLRRTSSRFLRFAAKLGFLFGRRLGKVRAEGIAVRAQRFNLGLERANVSVERQQRADVELDALVADCPF